jgi:hypothetical protein
MTTAKNTKKEALEEENKRLRALLEEAKISIGAMTFMVGAKKKEGCRSAAYEDARRVYGKLKKEL